MGSISEGARREAQKKAQQDAEARQRADFSRVRNAELWTAIQEDAAEITQMGFRVDLDDETGVGFFKGGEERPVVVIGYLAESKGYLVAPSSGMPKSYGDREEALRSVGALLQSFSSGRGD